MLNVKMCNVAEIKIGAKQHDGAEATEGLVAES
jgi:hypothetical protein